MRLIIMLMSLYFIIALDRGKDETLELPQAVEEGFYDQYPGVVGETWEETEVGYKVTFEWEDTEYEALYGSNGECLMLMAVDEPEHLDRNSVKQVSIEKEDVCLDNCSVGGPASPVRLSNS